MLVDNVTIRTDSLGCRRLDRQHWGSDLPAGSSGVAATTEASKKVKAAVQVYTCKQQHGARRQAGKGESANASVADVGSMPLSDAGRVPIRTTYYRATYFSIAPVRIGAYDSDASTPLVSRGSTGNVEYRSIARSWSLYENSIN